MPGSAAFPEVLRAVEEHFAALDDRRFLPPGAPDPALPTLRELLTARGRVTPAARRRIAAALLNSGAWLRQLHMITVEGAEPPPRGSVAEVKEGLRESAATVAAHERDEWVVSAADRAIAAIDAGALRDPIAVGLAHGSFGPGAVVVSPEGAVAGVGIQAPGRRAIYRDLAHFVVSLRIRSGRARSSGVKRFLSGYFEDGPVPQRALVVFALLASLEEWASAAPEGILGEAASRALRDEVSALCSLLER